MLTGTEPPQISSDLPLYRQQLLEMKNEGTNTLYVDFNHLFRYNDVMANAIAGGYYRFEPFLRAALQAFVENHIPSYSRMSASNQIREFWISIYGLGVVHRYNLLSSTNISYQDLDCENSPLKKSVS